MTQDRPGIVNCALYAAGRRVRDIDIDEIGTVLKQEDSFVWLGLYEPDEELMRRVQQQFGLHDLAVEDAHKAHQRPKVETFDDSLFVVLRTAQIIDGSAHFGETHVFVGARYVVSVRHGASQSYRPARAACEAAPHLLEKGTGFVLYALMDFVVDHYFPVAEALEDQLTALEDGIFSGRFDRASTEAIYAIKRDLVELRRAVAPIVDMCSALMGFRMALVPGPIKPYFRDVQDHALHISEAIDAMREMLSTALQVNLSLASMRQNDVTKALAGWGAILAVPTMVFGVYGMNFEHMPELHWQYGYETIVTLTGAICLLLHRRLKRAGWL